MPTQYSTVLRLLPEDYARLGAQQCLYGDISVAFDEQVHIAPSLRSSTREPKSQTWASGPKLSVAFWRIWAIGSGLRRIGWPSGGVAENFHFGVTLNCLLCHIRDMPRRFFIQRVFTTLTAHFGRDVLDDDDRCAPFQSHGNRSRLGCAMAADHTLA